MPSAGILIEAVDSALPDEGERWLLRAAAGQAGEVEKAWHRWIGLHGGYSNALLVAGGAAKPFQPLLFDSLSRHGVEVPPQVMTHLKAVSVREERRAAAYREIAREALLRLFQAGFPAMVLGGTLLSEKHYRIPALRHCASLHLLVPEEAVARVSKGLDAPPFRLTAVGAMDGERGFFRLRHESGMPLSLDTHFLPVPAWRELSRRAWKGSRQTTIFDMAVIEPAPEDMLLHLCLHPFITGGWGALFWALDAHLLIRSRRHLAWDMLVRSAETAGLALPLGASLKFVQETFGSSVPSRVIAALRDPQRRVAPMERDLALLGARLNAGPGRMGRILRRLPWGFRRLQVLCWMLFPSRAYMRWAHGSRKDGVLPVLYLGRVLRGLRDR